MNVIIIIVWYYASLFWEGSFNTISGIHNYYNMIELNDEHAYIVMEEFKTKQSEVNT